MKFKKLLGYVEDSSYIAIEIEGGDYRNCIGDQVWINREGTRMEVTDMASESVLRETADLFERSSKRAFKGALRRMGVTFD